MKSMTTVGLLDGYQCRCDWEDDGATKITLISTDKSLAWSGAIGKELLEDKGFRKKVAGEEDASDKVNLKRSFLSLRVILFSGSFRCADKCIFMRR